LRRSSRRSPQARSESQPSLSDYVYLQNATQPPLALRELTIRPLPIPTPIADFTPHSLYWETSEGWAAVVKYNTDLFEEAAFIRLTKHFQVLLEGIWPTRSCRLLNCPS